jgi:hypothetical protein
VKGSFYAAFIRTILTCIFTTVPSVETTSRRVIRWKRITPAVPDKLGGVDNAVGKARDLCVTRRNGREFVITRRSGRDL